MEKLLCPYCGGEMRRGWVRSRRSDIWWEPDPAASSDEEMRCIAAAAGFSGAAGRVRAGAGCGAAFWPPAVRPQSGHWLRRAS